MHAHRPAALLEECNDMEGSMSARPSPTIPKPREEAVRLLGEGGLGGVEGCRTQGWRRDQFPCSQEVS